MREEMRLRIIIIGLIISLSTVGCTQEGETPIPPPPPIDNPNYHQIMQQRIYIDSLWRKEADSLADVLVDQIRQFCDINCQSDIVLFQITRGLSLYNIELKKTTIDMTACIANFIKKKGFSHLSQTGFNNGRASFWVRPISARAIVPERLEVKKRLCKTE